LEVAAKSHFQLIPLRKTQSKIVLIFIPMNTLSKKPGTSILNLSAFQENLLNWYSTEKRDLPWRWTKDPYKILVSEVMLQQTQVETVIPYYNRWMDQFDSVDKLASASLDKILNLWEGMGYYSRAKNLHRAAQEIVKKYQSRFPESFRDLIKLPGIGKYTAGAVASIAFNQAVPAVDANVKRVISRLLCSHSPPQKIWDIAQSLIDKNSPADFNQAMMELGALICISKNPRCKICPVSSFCQAYKRGVQERFPPKRKSRKIEEISTVLGILVDNGKIYIQKRPLEGLWGGLWEFPGGKIEPGEAAEEALYREIREELGVEIIIIGREKSIRHAYTRFRVILYPYLCQLKRNAPLIPQVAELRWVLLEELSRFAFPAANRKIIQILKNNKRFLELIEHSKNIKSPKTYN
jgi:A/G-specific adenine glycosylase